MLSIVQANQSHVLLLNHMNLLMIAMMVMVQMAILLLLRLVLRFLLLLKETMQAVATTQLLCLLATMQAVSTTQLISLPGTMQLLPKEMSPVVCLLLLVNPIMVCLFLLLLVHPIMVCPHLDLLLHPIEVVVMDALDPPTAGQVPSLQTHNSVPLPMLQRTIVKLFTLTKLTLLICVRKGHQTVLMLWTK